MNTPTPRTDDIAGSLIDAEEVVPADFARALERELATERETSRLLRVSMDARYEGYTQSRRRMSALESEVTAKGQAVRNLAEVISGQDKELAVERARLDSGRILLTVSGERVWHCGVDLRAAIDAGIKEDAK